MATTYNDVLTLCTALHAGGQPITPRAVRRELGGPISDKTLREYVRRARAELRAPDADADPEPEALMLTETPGPPGHQAEDLAPPPAPEDLDVWPPRAPEVLHHQAQLAGLQAAHESRRYLRTWQAATELLLRHLSPAVAWLSAERLPPGAVGWQAVDPIEIGELVALWHDDVRQAIARAAAIAERLDQALAEVSTHGARNPYAFEPAAGDIVGTR
jgi:hypothetical protein